VEITAQSYSEAHAFEEYECVSCGDTGTYSFGDGADTMTGCVVDA
jgi:hypothetical protein